MVAAHSRKVCLYLQYVTGLQFRIAFLLPLLQIVCSKMVKFVRCALKFYPNNLAFTPVSQLGNIPTLL